MNNNYTIAQRNALVEKYLWCIDTVIRKNRPLMRAAQLEYDDVYQQLALRLIRAVAGFDPQKGTLQQHIFAQLKYELLNCKSAYRLCGLTGAPKEYRKSDMVSLDHISEGSSLYEQVMAAYLWRLPADREKVESVLNRFCINPMQEKVNDVREMALDSQAGFEEACGDGSRADLARKAFIKLRGELVRLYQKQCELRTSAQSDSETALMDGLLNDLEDISRRAHEKTGFTYTPLSEIAALN